MEIELKPASMIENNVKMFITKEDLIRILNDRGHNIPPVCGISCAYDGKEIVICYTTYINL